MKNNYKILIIDDDPTLCLIAEKMLSSEGYRVLTAGTGRQGLTCIKENRPDLIMLDYGLPDMTGVEVCQKLRTLPAGIDKPVLFITWKNDYLSIENAFNAGATDFSHKPLDWDVLLYRIKYLLNSHETFLSLVSSQNRLITAQKIAKIVNWDYHLVSKKFIWTESVYSLLEITDKRQVDMKYFLHHHVPSHHLQIVSNAIDLCVQDNQSFKIEHEIVTENSETKIVSHFGHIVKNKGTVEYIGTIQDITERRKNELQIRKLAYYDSLTGLMNRELFLLTMNEILTRNKEQGELSALLFIDLDDFKRINDTLGHDYGDELLCEITARLKSSIRLVQQESDKNFINWKKKLKENAGFDQNVIDYNRYDIGRIGGDEFSVYLSEIKHDDDAILVASRLLETLDKPFILKGYEVYVTFSIGIAIAPAHGEDTQTLLKSADTAMYQAKTSGKNNFKIYLESMNNHSRNRLSLESGLRNAIKKDQLHLVYQPKIDLQTGALVGAEALMRWTHETMGVISPAEFIPMAEQTGQILPIGDWLFDEFSSHLKRWNLQNLIPKDFKLALNVSSMQFHHNNIMRKIDQIFNDLDLNKHVEFELTETVMMENANSNLEKLDALVKKNISLSLDDFGTGYSSLSYLHRFPVDTVKIDRYFILNMQSDGQINIIRAIIAMAHGMGIKVVAEGIENQEQLDFLKAEGCDTGQGYYFYKPMAAERFQQLLEDQTTQSEQQYV